MSANTVPSLFTCHLKNTSSVRYLRPRLSAAASQRFVNGDLAEEFRRLHKEEAYFMAPAFAAGRVLADAMLDRLISQAYFNPLIIPLFHALVASSDNTQGRGASTGHGVGGGVGGGGGETSADKAGFLIHVQVPVKMIGRTFAELFDVILEEKGYIPIALYRAPYEGEEPQHARPRARAPTVFFEGARSAPGQRIKSKSIDPTAGAAAKRQNSGLSSLRFDRPKRTNTTPKHHLRSNTSTSIAESLRESMGRSASSSRRHGNIKSFGEVVDSNPLPYVYTSPIPGAIVGSADTVICLTNTVGNPVSVSGLKSSSLEKARNIHLKRAVSAEAFAL